MSYSDKKGSTAPGSSQIYKETTVPLAVQPKNVIDTTEVSTPHSKKKQVRISDLPVKQYFSLTNNRMIFKLTMLTFF